MRGQLEQRLQELKEEFVKGQRSLAEVEARQADLKETVLRISGAIMVLEEELAKSAETLATDATDASP